MVGLIIGVRSTTPENLKQWPPTWRRYSSLELLLISTCFTVCVERFYSQPTSICTLMSWLFENWNWGFDDRLIFALNHIAKKCLSNARKVRTKFPFNLKIALRNEWHVPNLGQMSKEKLESRSVWNQSISSFLLSLPLRRLCARLWNAQRLGRQRRSAQGIVGGKESSGCGVWRLWWILFLSEWLWTADTLNVNKFSLLGTEGKV